MHFLGEPEALSEFRGDRVKKYVARVILTRVIEPLAPDTPKSKPIPHAQTKKFDEKPRGGSGQD